MKRGQPLKRRTPLKRSMKPLARTRERRSTARKRTPMSKDLREQVYTRSGGVCDACGVRLTPDAWDAHHRQLRGMGNGRGRDTLANLVALHHHCHMWAHEHPVSARVRGLIVPSWADPETSPVLRHGTHWEQPGETWTPAPPPEEPQP